MTPHQDDLLAKKWLRFEAGGYTHYACGGSKLVGRVYYKLVSADTRVLSHFDANRVNFDQIKSISQGSTWYHHKWLIGVKWLNTDALRPERYILGTQGLIWISAKYIEPCTKKKADQLLNNSILLRQEKKRQQKHYSA